MIIIKDLVKRYDQTLAVDHLNFHIKKGQVIGLLGPNGAGKTTTLHAIMGLIPWDSGDIEIFGKTLKTHEIEIKKQIGFVPQYLALYDDLSVEENLYFFGKLYGINKSELKSKITEALEKVDLVDERKKLAKQLSGGLRRRLNIGCALIHDPKLLIVDEPTVGIDPRSRKEILNTLKSLNQSGTTIVYTSHYMDEVEYLCDEVIVMSKGRVIAEGDVNTLTQLVTKAPVITFKFREGTLFPVDKMSDLYGVQQVQYFDDCLKVSYHADQISKNEMIGEVIQSGFEIQEIIDSKPSLEEIYLIMTGEALNGEETC